MPNFDQPSRRSFPYSHTLLLGLTLTVGTLVAPANPVHASESCPIAKPCIVDLFQTGNSIFIRWKAPSRSNYDFYQVHWTRDGMSEARTWEGRGESFRLHNANSGMQYQLMVQGCVLNPYSPFNRSLVPDTRLSLSQNTASNFYREPLNPYPGSLAPYVCTGWSYGYITPR